MADPDGRGLDSTPKFRPVGFCPNLHDTKIHATARSLMISQQAVRTRSEREGGISGRGLVEGVITELKKILCFLNQSLDPSPPPPSKIPDTTSAIR